MSAELPEFSSSSEPARGPADGAGSLRCPNCSHPVDSAPVTCGVCGYRSENVAEYFWLYIAGGLLGVAGLVLGLAGVATQGDESRSWAAPLRGWLPLGPWPEGSHWLSLLVAGIALSLVGMGFTRHFRGALWGGTALGITALIFTLKKLLLGLPEPPSPYLASALLAIELAFLAVLWRLRRALNRTPARDVARLQAGRRGLLPEQQNRAHRP